ncbi:putative hydroxymethylglutaryl-CoA synthase [Candidatus Methanoperedens nitroreducens]|uniref:Hydroxymethylglutaryl-CoA synthase n=1 Tax=Candidatus Methanoperedens nitratireducens TaxID=1392998 RepID=A0A062V480_9EURY|nr:hydroxymethylglutaryl-CoA synthase [Candidatus Methanoperedens nitroreducens]KCZ72152.1 putative hydroxymethylglutaryl-CoA synthase [Candidatus Methanoperedens nitroreducens]MDJ1421871.1 hydroxymethylglutaryl-CoA synthase [Candidatus Methanoperedens sp.]
MNVGIVSYGAYIPCYRIKIEEIAKVWGDNASSIIDGLMIYEKSVPDMDEDTITIAVEAARNAINRGGVNPERIEAVFTGSESHPYAVKPTSTVVAEAIGATPNLTAADFEFACKAGTAAVQACIGLAESGMIDLGLAIGSDVSQGAPGDALEYTAAAGGVAFIIGKEKTVAKIESTYSFTTDTPDFWRREGMPYPEHGGRFTGEPGYFKHVTSAASGLMDRMGTKPSDYKYAIFHQPNGKFPVRAAKMLGFSTEQIKPGLVVSRLGNTYSGSCMMGLAATLDIARPGDRIFVTAFGSGAGSDAFSIRVTDRIDEIRNGAPSVEELLANPIYINYATYAKHKGKIKL